MDKLCKSFTQYLIKWISSYRLVEKKKPLRTENCLEIEKEKGVRGMVAIRDQEREYDRGETRRSNSDHRIILREVRAVDEKKSW